MVETREVNAKRGVTSDETIEFTSAKGRKQCPHRLRRIGYHDRKTGKDYVFLTTHFHLSAKTIADIYKSRWQVELFFKWIKQNLKVKSFVGTSRNAVMTQVWTAMCIYLILSYIKFANRIAWRLSEILRLLQLNLFERRAASGVAGKRKRESTGSFIPVDDEVHVDLVGQQCYGTHPPLERLRRTDGNGTSKPARGPAPESRKMQSWSVYDWPNRHDIRSNRSLRTPRSVAAARRRSRSDRCTGSLRNSDSPTMASSSPARRRISPTRRPAGESASRYGHSSTTGPSRTPRAENAS